MKNVIKKIKSKPLFRSFAISREHIDEEARTVELSFSSEHPVERWFGNEILDHSKKSVRLGRLLDGGPILVDHDRTDHVGVVDSVSLDSRQGRVTARFGNSTRANEIFQDVIDGIRKSVSVGYRVYKMVLEKTENDIDTYRITDWEPLEVSLVSIPADPSVGVGRADDGEYEIEVIDNRSESSNETSILVKNDSVIGAVELAEVVKRAVTESNDNLKRNNEMTDEEKKAAEQEAENKRQADIKAAADKATEKARNDELARMRNIERLGKLHNREELARQFVDNGKSQEEFRDAVLESLGDASPATRVNESPDIGMTPKEIKRFSFLRAMSALANPRDLKMQEAAAFEFECSRAMADKARKDPQGVMVPFDVLSTERNHAFAAQMVRDLLAGTASAGGDTVATDLLSGSFIDLLRNRMIVNTLGATVMNDLQGDISIPRQTGGATGYWVSENASPTESEQTFDQVKLSPKTVGAFTDYSRKLLLQSSIDVENFVRMDLAKVIGLALDIAALYGTGASNQPQGVGNVTGINTKSFTAGGAPTYAEIVELETLVAADNADVGTLAYALSPTMRGYLKTTEKATNTAQFIWEQGNTVNGYRTEVSKQITAAHVMYGNWADLLIGFWSGLDIMVDPYSGSTAGTVRIVALQDTDVAVRHPESFVLGQ